MSHPSREEFFLVLKEATPAIEQLAYKYCNGDPVFADDLIQQAFVRCIRRFNRHQESLDRIEIGWITIAARWEMLNYIRREVYRKQTQCEIVSNEGKQLDEFKSVERGGRKPLTTGQAHGVDRFDLPERSAGKGLVFDQVYDEKSPEDLTSLKEKHELVMDCFNRIPERFQDVARCCLIEGMSYKETEAALDVPIGTVMSRLYRARRYLIEEISNCPALGGYDDIHKMFNNTTRGK